MHFLHVSSAAGWAEDEDEDGDEVGDVWCGAESKPRSNFRNQRNS